MYRGGLVEADWEIEASPSLCVNQKAVKRQEWLKYLLLTAKIYYLKFWVIIGNVYIFTFRPLKKRAL